MPSPAPKHEAAAEIPKTAGPQEVKLLVKDHTTSVDEALRLIAPIFVLIPQAMMMGPNPVFVQHSKLTLAELQVLHYFLMNITVNMLDLTVEDRLKRAVSELSKLVQSGHPSTTEQ